MGVTKITIGKGGTINTGNYESVRGYAEIEYTLEPGETVEDAQAKASAEAGDLLLAELAPALERMEPWQVKKWKALAGLPEAPTVSDEPLFPQ